MRACEGSELDNKTTTTARTIRLIHVSTESPAMSMSGLVDGGWDPSEVDQRHNSTSSGDVENCNEDIENDDENEDHSPELETPALSNGNKKPSDKTISCVSCRKRKLKCDRIKPRCGTCTRLRHDCEFPERKRNLGSKRRNMKELEARLGMNAWSP